jgi:DNA-directed RNA polymerase subunit RPC12/RpoP
MLESPPKGNGCKTIRFETTELARVGVVCKECSTEVVFDLKKSRAAEPEQACPGCGDKDFLRPFNPFGTKPFFVVSVFEKLAALDAKSRIRLYFKAD